MRKGRKPIEECIDCDSEDIEIIKMLGVYVDDVSKKYLLNTYITAMIVTMNLLELKNMMLNIKISIRKEKGEIVNETICTLRFTQS